MSESESICSPKALWVLVMRATRPSRLSRHHGAKDANGGQVEPAVHGHDDGVKATKQSRQGEQIGQHVDALAALAHHHATASVHHVSSCAIMHVAFLVPRCWQVCKPSTFQASSMAGLQCKGQPTPALDNEATKATEVALCAQCSMPISCGSGRPACSWRSRASWRAVAPPTTSMLVIGSVAATGCHARGSRSAFQNEHLGVVAVLDVASAHCAWPARDWSLITSGPVTYSPYSALLEIE